MRVKAIKTKKFVPPKDNLGDLIDVVAKHLRERSIVVVSSKVIAICEGRCVPQEEYNGDKEKLAQKEADLYLEKQEFLPTHSWMHTIKDGILIASAGIDKSNSKDYFVLWPKNPQASAELIYKELKKLTQIKDFGVVISDSHTIPFRRGLVGLCIAYFGFKPLIDERGTPDIFGEPLHVAQRNVPDSMAVAAVYNMGEGGQQTPVALISDIPDVEFIDHEYKTQDSLSVYEIPMDEDIYKVFFLAPKWKKGQGGV